MAEYLPGYEEQRAQEFRPARVDAMGAAPGGAIADGYESYVRGVFRPCRGSDKTPALAQSEYLFPRTGIDFEALRRPNCRPSASSSTPVADALNFDGFGTVGEGQTGKPVSAMAMLRMENQFGKEALDDSLDNVVLRTPLDSVYEELGIASAIRRTGGSQFSVYAPKSSREYFVQRESYARPSAVTSLTASEKDTSSSYREKSDAEWRKSNRQMLIDYKDFDSSPLSPYMYREHPYVQRQDSRIVGSNFVQLTTRPRDRFLDKINETLAEVRAMPRY